jgi:DNA helicase-2/ATP-dependent DNA helicase PcrA
MPGMSRNKKNICGETYKNFYQWLSKPELFKTAKNGRLEYADVFPLIYLKLRLESIRSPFKRVKHLLIDEMQDYTPVQYAVIAKLFNCKKTILGDANQSVNPYSSSNADEIKRAFIQATCVTLNKSYRSTCEIARFAQRISPNPDLEVIERHGEEPRILKCGTQREELARISELTKRFNASDHNTLAVICKTQKQARQVFKGITDEIEDTQLLSEESQTFAGGVLVCTAHMAKGLEFDQVIIPGVTESDYSTAMDRNLLYVACTRAMHVLCLTYTGELSSFMQR